MYRAKYLLQLIFGPDHLEQAAFDVSLDVLAIVHQNFECDLSSNVNFNITSVFFFSIVIVKDLI